MFAIKNTDSGCLRVLKNIFRSRRQGGGWDSRLGKKLHKGEPHNSNSLLTTNVLGWSNRGGKDGCGMQQIR